MGNFHQPERYALNELGVVDQFSNNKTMVPMKSLQYFIFGGTRGNYSEDNAHLPDHHLFDVEPVDLNDIQDICRKIENRYVRDARRMHGKGKQDAFFRTFDPKSPDVALPKQRHRLRGNAALEAIKAEIQKAWVTLELAKKSAQRDKADEQRLQTLEQFAKDLALAEADLDKLPLIVRHGKAGSIEQQLQRNEAKFNTLYETKYGKVDPTRYFYDYPAGYWGGCAFLYSSEIVVNYPAIVELGEISNALALALTFAVSGLMSITAMMSGAALCKGKILNGILWGVAGLALCLGVMVLRWDKNIVLTFAVFVFYGISLLLSYAKAINFDLFQSGRQVIKLKRRLARAVTKSARIESADQLRRTKINTQNEGQTGSFSMIWSRALQQQIDGYTGQLLRLEVLQKQYESRLNSLFSEGCLNYDHGYLLMSRTLFRRAAPDISFEAMPPLTAVEEEPKASDNGQAGLLAVKPLVVLLICTSLWSCASPETHDITILIDQTPNAQHTELSGLSRYVFDQVLQLDESGMRDQFRLTVSTIGETSKQRTKLLELPRGDPWITRRDVDRRREISDFIASVDSLLAKTLSTRDSLSQSFIHENIAFHLNRLSHEPEEDHRVLICVSDMLMHTPALSFYRNPEALNDFEALEKTLLNLMPLEGCQSIDLRIIHLPVKSTDALFSKSLDFWTWLYERCGATVSYVPGL